MPRTSVIGEKRAYQITGYRKGNGHYFKCEKCDFVCLGVTRLREHMRTFHAI